MGLTEEMKNALAIKEADDELTRIQKLLATFDAYPPTQPGRLASDEFDKAMHAEFLRRFPKAGGVRPKLPRRRK